MPSQAGVLKALYEALVHWDVDEGVWTQWHVWPAWQVVVFTSRPLQVRGSKDNMVAHALKL